MGLTNFHTYLLPATLIPTLRTRCCPTEYLNTPLPPHYDRLTPPPSPPCQSAGANPEDTTMVLTRTSSTSVTSPKIGALLEWEFVIKLPTVSGMDMTVEAFVADLDTGQCRAGHGVTEARA